MKIRDRTTPKNMDLTVTFNSFNCESFEFCANKTDFGIGKANPLTEKGITNMNKIGNLIKDIADIIRKSPLQQDFDLELYAICKYQGNIESKIQTYIKNKTGSMVIDPNKTSRQAVIINNGSFNFNQVQDYCIYTTACQIDAGSHKASIEENGNMKLTIESENNSISINLINGNGKKKLIVNIKLGSITDENTYIISNKITMQDVYLDILKLFTDRIESRNFTWPQNTDPDYITFMGKFITTYSIKTLGDFLQEVNAVIKNGGYEGKPTYTYPTSSTSSSTSVIKPAEITNTDKTPYRLYMVNDRISHARFLFMRKLFPEENINMKSDAILDTISTKKLDIDNKFEIYNIPKHLIK